MRELKTATIALSVLVALAGSAGAADYLVTMAEICKNLDAYVGKRVIITDCLMIGANNFAGAQCSVNPIDSATLVYIDSDTWAPQARKLANDCTTAIIEQMCTLKVTGDVAKNVRGQPFILGATLEIVKRPFAPT
jgi:hypothetical protein